MRDFPRGTTHEERAADTVDVGRPSPGGDGPAGWLDRIRRDGERDDEDRERGRGRPLEGLGAAPAAIGPTAAREARDVLTTGSTRLPDPYPPGVPADGRGNSGRHRDPNASAAPADRRTGAPRPTAPYAPSVPADPRGDPASSRRPHGHEDRNPRRADDASLSSTDAHPAVASAAPRTRSAQVDAPARPRPDRGATPIPGLLGRLTAGDTPAEAPPRSARGPGVTGHDTRTRPGRVDRDGPDGSRGPDGPRGPDRNEPGSASHRRAPEPSPDLLRAAAEFITLHYAEEGLGDPARRIAAVRAEIADTGTYWHTTRELVFGARVAWRNANRCIGRLYWNALSVRDRREVRDAGEVAEESADHLREATRGGRIRSLITVFAPDSPRRPGPRIWNEQLIRYAGHPRPDGGVTGDPRNAGLTATARRLGWPGGPGTPFDVLPLVIQDAGAEPRWFALPKDAVLEVELGHPEYTWWQGMGLRWHAVPAISNMCLEIGGVCYPAAPFNGWYMGTEIGARNLADTDRYDLLPVVAERLGLDTRTDRSLWKDRALVELNRSVLHSFDRAGVTVTDHHTESRRFLTHLGREERKGRQVGADWSWIVPPISGSATPVFHRTFDTVERTPAYVHHPEATERARGAAPPARLQGAAGPLFGGPAEPPGLV